MGKHRILANRQSAQRSRVRKLQYISELERSVTALQVSGFDFQHSPKNVAVSFPLFVWLFVTNEYVFFGCFDKLKSEVSMLTPRVAFLDHQRMILNVDNSALKAKIAALAQDKIFKDGKHTCVIYTFCLDTPLFFIIQTYFSLVIIFNERWSHRT